MTKEAPQFAQAFCDQLASGLGFKTMDDLANVITLGRAVQDFVGKQSPAAPAGLTTPRFEKVMVGSVHVVTRDRANGLEWDVTDFGGKRFEFEAAKKACASLRTGGHADWRLPTVQELLSLVDYERASPACDKEFFPNTKTDYYYRTSTPYKPDSGCAWGVYFYGGDSSALYHDGVRFVRAVRASQS